MQLFDSDTCPACGEKATDIAHVNSGELSTHRWMNICRCNDPPVVWDGGEDLRRRRVHAERSIGGLAEYLNVDVAYMSALERGTEKPAEDFLRRWTAKVEDYENVFRWKQERRR